MNLFKHLFDRSVTQADMMVAMEKAKRVYPDLAISIDMTFWEHNIGKEIEIEYKLYIAGSPCGGENAHFQYFPTLPALIAFLDAQATMPERE